MMEGLLFIYGIDLDGQGQLERVLGQGLSWQVAAG